jgi:hypothetical protein
MVWVNNSRHVAFKAMQVRQEETERLPRPLWAFALDEVFVDGLSVRPAEGGVPNGALVAAGSFRVGPYLSGRSRLINASVTDRVALSAQHAAVLAGLGSVTVLAWVRRNNSGVERGVLTLAHAAGNRKLDLSLAAGVNVQVRARGASTDALQTLAAGAALTDFGRMHLIGGFADVVGDRLGVFLDDAGLAAVPVGFYQTAAAAFASSEFTAEAHAAESAIGVSNGIVNPWTGEIATVALYAGVLSARQVNAIWNAGRRGVVR